jgi:hypothetical protein
LRELERAGEGEAGLGGEFSPFVPVGLPGGSLPFQFVVSDLAEVMEPEIPAYQGRTAPEALGSALTVASGAGRNGDNPHRPAPASPFHKGEYPLPPSTVINGRISRPGEVDRYRLSVTPGQHWNFEIEAATLGTSSSPFLTLQDPATHKPLALADLFDKDDPYKQLVKQAKRCPADLVHCSMASEIVLAVFKTVRPRWSQLRLPSPCDPITADFSLELVEPSVNIPINGTAAIEVMVKRRGYRGPSTDIPDLPDDLIMSGGNSADEPNAGLSASATSL